MPAVLEERIREQHRIKKIFQHRFAGKVYLVGGALRELLLGQEPVDYDFVLAEPEDLAEFERLLDAKAFVLGKKPVLTQRIVGAGLSIDITFLDATIEDDLRRRDFTMNAIAYDMAEGEVIDCLGGVADIARRLIRFPGRYTFADDPLRMLKAVRHYAMLDGFVLDAELTRAVSEMKGAISRTAPERIKHEMDLILSSQRPREALRFMEATGLLFEIFPELSDLGRLDVEKGFELETLGHTIDGFGYLGTYAIQFGLDDWSKTCAGYALLFHDLGKAHTFSYDTVKEAVHFYHHEKISGQLAEKIMDRLRFSVHEARTVQKLIAGHMRVFLISVGESTEKAVRRLVYAMEETTPLLLVLTCCDLYGSSGGRENPSTVKVRQKCREVYREYEEWKKEPLPKIVNGRDLMNIGFRQGPSIGRVLDIIRERQIAGEITSRDEALAMARDYMVNNTDTRD